jgi:hypothetical protein
VVAAAETPAVSVVNGVNRAGKSPSMQRPSIEDSRARQACEDEPPWRASISGRRNCGGWNAKGIRPPNARKSARAKPRNR